ncbi:MAG: flagellar basal-body rod protein FlgF [Planctomycetes bacterium GWF2_41_51]|nr:MAG: flagellar basal-body rod protein FlgF [Planctomycetes bacterium GWF2_41_51]HBG26597.1 flagellar basal-body rod protein FlgF [Phycisphaerales bacterium]
MSDMNAQISSAVSGLTRELDIIANNLANISTVGYKRKCNTFSKILSAQESQQNSAGEAELKSAFDFSDGNFIQSGRTLDLALCGKGFFVVETAEGPLYTRNGSFDLNKNGQLVDSQGRTVAGANGPITIPQGISVSQINVASDGSITAGENIIGKLKIVDFKDKENELTAAGLNCYSAPKEVQPGKPENVIVKQGYLEGSNVQMVEELVDMIMVSRLYEANMKFLSVGSENTKSLINVAMG